MCKAPSLTYTSRPSFSSPSVFQFLLDLQPGTCWLLPLPLAALALEGGHTEAVCHHLSWGFKLRWDFFYSMCLCYFVVFSIGDLKSLGMDNGFVWMDLWMVWDIGGQSLECIWMMDLHLSQLLLVLERFVFMVGFAEWIFWMVLIVRMMSGLFRWHMTYVVDLVCASWFALDGVGCSSLCVLTCKVPWPCGQRVKPSLQATTRVGRKAQDVKQSSWRSHSLETCSATFNKHLPFVRFFRGTN